MEVNEASHVDRQEGINRTQFIPTGYLQSLYTLSRIASIGFQQRLSARNENVICDSVDRIAPLKFINDGLRLLGISRQGQWLRQSQADSFVCARGRGWLRLPHVPVQNCPFRLRVGLRKPLHATPAPLSLKLFSLAICNACSESPRAFFSSPKWAALPGAAKPKILIPASLPEAHCSSRCMPASSQSRSHRMQIEVNIGVIEIAAQPHGENRPGFIGTVLCHIRNCNHIKDGELMRANPHRLVGFLHAFLELPKKNGVVNGQI